ncbi:hypothetical protein PR202_ga26005 [Eleusine coracana subsp. coracana]|uniref:F-box associated domain-containing protein n=1 Tax=Eleusine coracana subsp. coracana TaxID=191504 RepID=A0AAV5DAR2_ELECO|nr:hypothetical protein PR202_ga26005 [Eleusine coracana subsp. coracana]
MPPVFLHGSLLLVFETDDESFRSMSPPVISEYSKCFMFGTKEGKLALSSWDQDGWMAKLWIMQDYENQAWAFTYKIQVPLENRVGKDEPLDDVTIVSEDGDMLVEFMSARTVLHYDKNGSLLRTLKSFCSSDGFDKWRTASISVLDKSGNVELMSPIVDVAL